MEYIKVEGNSKCVVENITGRILQARSKSTYQRQAFSSHGKADFRPVHPCDFLPGQIAEM